MLELFLLAAFLSPLVLAAASGWAFVNARRRKLPKPAGGYLIFLSVIYGCVGAAATLAWTIYAMGNYESSSGVDAGNGPLGWIVLYGPLGFAAGELLALVQWWMSRPSPKELADRGAT